MLSVLGFPPEAMKNYVVYFRDQYKRTDEVQNVSREVDRVQLMLEDRATKDRPVRNLPSISRRFHFFSGDIKGLWNS